MPRLIKQQQKTKYFRFRRLGFTREEAAAKAGFSLSTAAGLEREAKTDNSTPGNRPDRFAEPEGPIPLDELGEDARDCLEDFARFRAYYLGSVSVPWQEEMAQRVRGLYESPQDEYVVVNCPQGGGKTRFFSHDLAAWLTIRDRALRGILGAHGLKYSKLLTEGLRKTFARTSPVRPKDELVRSGKAVNATSTLVEGYGTLKPTADEANVWRVDQFTVAQHGGEASPDKEPTWAAFSYEAQILGWRVDLMIWDDLVNSKMLRNPDAVDELNRWWDDEAESRLDDGGLCLLVGQRLRSNDIYRYCLDKVDVTELEGGEEPDEYSPRQYTHIVYKAHYAELCEGRHQRDDPAYLAGGCLLDPNRVTWQKCKAKMAAGNFEVLFQQEDSDPANVLVPKVWIDGGRKDGVSYEPVWDMDRPIGTLPTHFAPGSYMVRCMTVDPSPTKWWGILDWLYVLPPNTEPLAGQRYLIDVHRAKMGANEFLDFSRAQDDFVGLAEDWVSRSRGQAIPISYIIIEKNAAQRWAQQYEFFQSWASSRGVIPIEHETMSNKADETFGIWQTIPRAYQYGRVRLPGEHGSQSRHRVWPLVAELTTYPDGATDDLVMSQWFFEYNLQHLVRQRHRIGNIHHDQPAWARSMELVSGAVR